MSDDPGLEFEVVDDRSPKRQMLIARMPGNPDPVGTLKFGWGAGPGVIRTTAYATADGYRRKGIATKLAYEMFRRYPNTEIVEGGGGNTEDGDALLESLRRVLRYHPPRCFQASRGCQCDFPTTPG